MLIFAVLRQGTEGKKAVKKQRQTGLFAYDPLRLKSFNRVHFLIQILLFR